MCMALCMIRVYIPESVFDMIKSLNFSSGTYMFLKEWKWGWLDNNWIYDIRVDQHADFKIT